MCIAGFTLVVMPILTILLSSAAAWLGRWIQLHPEKILPKGHFAADSATARIYRVQIACMGSFAVFAGTWGAILNIFALLIHRLRVTRRTALFAGAALGIAAAIYVRREVRARQRPQPASVNRSWP
jgi:hypothetical protein